jgi:hypothetical protein
VVVACFEVLAQHIPGETEESHEKPQDSWSSDQALNLDPP